MNHRRYCTHCHYPLSTCLCSVLRPVKSQCRIDILQHPKEAKAAKNTAHLLKLCMPQQVNLWLGENEHDFDELKLSLDNDTQNTLLLYPAEHANDLTLAAQPSALVSVRLILIDATWRKAYKMWQLNPWLWPLPTYKLSNRASHYARSASVSGALSTLECVRHTLEHLEKGLDLSPLDDIFRFRQKQLEKPESPAISTACRRL